MFNGKIRFSERKFIPMAITTLDVIAYRLLPDGPLEWAIAIFVGLVIFAFFAVIALVAAAPVALVLLVPGAISIVLVVAMLWLSS